jgi:uncharacterized protein (TIGR02147 family)
MQNLSVFENLDYLGFLRAQIKANKTIHGYKAKLADAANCQRSYLSQVLIEKAHLTPDQAINLCRFWNLNIAESSYFLNLVHLARAATRTLKEFYSKELQKIRKEQGQLSKRYLFKEIEPNEQSIYYSNWIYGAVHMLVTIPTYQDVESISEKLNISTKVITGVLEELEKLNLVSRDKKRWVATEKQIHVSSNSRFNSLNHQNWRNYAVRNSSSDPENGIHYTAVYSLSLYNFKRLQTLLLEFIDMTRDMANQSPEEEVVNFNCDLFKL